MKKIRRKNKCLNQGTKDGKVVEMKVDIPNNYFRFDELEFKKKK